MRVARCFSSVSSVISAVTIAVFVLVVDGAERGGGGPGGGGPGGGGAGGGVGDGQPYIINGARCYVRCLTLLQNRQYIPVDSFSTSTNEEPSPVSLSDCRIDEACEDCSRPCDHQFVNMDKCTENCNATKHRSGESGCQESCRFLRQVNSIRPGTCPPETQATGFAAVCIKSCDSDADCEAPSLKCCSNGCGWTCQQPSHVHDGMPEIPSAPVAAESLDLDEAVDLQWRPQSINTSSAGGNVVYNVESRSHLGKYPNDALWSRWQHVTQITTPSCTVNGLKPGTWYQYRVMAINIYGSRGVSGPSLPFALSREPDRPDPPSNLTEGVTLVQDGKVAVDIHWSPPASSDLPVTRYKIYWSKRLKTVAPQFVSLQEFKQGVPGDRTYYRISDLEPNTTYFIQVQALCQRGDGRLKSDKANMYITTYPVQRHPERAHQLTTQPSVTVRPAPTPIAPSGLSIDKTYFQNGLLRANISWRIERGADGAQEPDKFVVYWSPEGCANEKVLDEGMVAIMSATTHERFYTIYDLRFDCRYLLRIQPFSIKGVPAPMVHLFFTTPLCGKVLIIGETTPDCTRSARIPDEPLDVHHQFIVDSTNITAKLVWSPPISDVPIVSYIVVWGPVQSGSHQLLLNRTAAVSKTLSKDVKSLLMSGLSESTMYAVRVQATSRAGSGRVATLRFTTPQLQPIISDPPYRDVSAVLPGRVDTVRPHIIGIKQNPPQHQPPTHHPPHTHAPSVRGYGGGTGNNNVVKSPVTKSTRVVELIQQPQLPAVSSSSSASSTYYHFVRTNSFQLLFSCLLVLTMRMAASSGYH